MSFRKLLIAGFASILFLGLPALGGTMKLIDSGINAGNGQFYISDPSEASGLMGQYMDTPAVTTDIARSRAFIPAGGSREGTLFDTAAPTLSSVTDGHGIKIVGWSIYRDDYVGGNNAIGIDGNYGFAPAPADTTTNGGQAFANSNSILILSDTYSVAGQVGDAFCFSYLLGSDTNSGAATTSATGYLVFDGTTVIPVGGAASQTGTSSTNLVSETYTTTSAYSSVALLLRPDGGANGIRSLVDDVMLAVTPVPEPSSLTMLLFIGLGAMAVGRRR